MKALTFIAITLLSGAIAGTILALVNQGVVEPFIEQAIELENQQAAADGEIINPTELAAFRLWQKGGSIAAGAVLGLSLGALFGLVFAYGRKILPGSTNVKKAIVLAGIMWAVLYLVPAVKYPANPPAVGDPETIYLRMSLYVAILAISGFSALGVAILSRKVKMNRLVAPAVYGGIIAVAFVALPANPDAIAAPMDLVNSFRIASGATMTMFWVLLGAILGAFWDRTKPHETAQIKTA
ncbi:MAG: CbtA family protein [Nitrososphaera sp.]|uniref:CbtA family protein n=1 Tax=Nitrososphaera sp. TaxID=1971748 RepID=UPI003D6F2AD3